MAEIMHKTKEQNTFRYKTFSTRVEEIDLRRLALYHIGHVNEQIQEHENETNFHQTLKKWMVLNLTEEFSAFSRKFQKVVTLPQLVHQKDVVIDALLERLSTATNLSLQPLLELLYVLARDLRVDFYAYFQRVLDRLVNLLNTQDAEQLEWTFVCLAHLFKALKPYLRQNIGVVFNAILPLLDEQRYEEHITNFAVECFSYVAREVSDYRKFFDFVLETVAREQVQAVQGCGRLIFEIMRGVKGQFHSTAARFLGFLFDCLINEQFDYKKRLLLGEIVDFALQQLFKFMQTQSMTIFWQELCGVAGKASNSKQVEQLLPIFLRVVSYRNGKHLLEMDVVVPAVLGMIDLCVKCEDSKNMRQLSILVSKIVLTMSTQLTQLDISRLIKKILALASRDIYAEFVLLVVAHPQFELLVMPCVVAQFESHFDLPAFELMTRIVQEKQPLAKNAIQLPLWKPYDIHLKQPQTVQRLLAKFDETKLVDFESFGDMQNEQWQLLVLRFTLAPHIKALRAAPEVTASLNKYLKFVVNQYNTNKQTQETFALLFEIALHLNAKFTKNELETFLQTLLPNVGNIDGLNCLDQLIASNVGYFEQQREMLATHLSPLLTSHERKIRMTAAHCLKILHKNLISPYGCLFAAATIAPDLKNYREQLLHLQKLETGGELFKSFKPIDQLNVLRLLLGTLYENFKFIWEPVLQLIEDYAKKLPLNDFWPIYKQQLEVTAATIMTKYNENDKADIDDGVQTPEVAQLTLQELMNYRNLLWQRLPKFGTIAEQKNRELISLFVDFLQKEYQAKLQKSEHTWDLETLANTPSTTTLTNRNKTNAASQGALVISDYSDTDEDEDDDGNENDFEEGEEEHSSKKRKIKNKKRTSKGGNPLAKQLLQTLQIKLGIFSVQANPKALYREADLHALYMELLAGSNTQLQKQALDCIMAYKQKQLVTFKEQLYAINDEQRFKNELINFKLDTLTTEQRDVLMPILLRLLYGKMLTRGSRGVLTTQARKSLIFRFLAQCSLPEIFSFLQMAFGCYNKYTATNITDLNVISKMVRNDLKLSAVPSAKKLKSIVNLLELIRKEFGGLMGAEFHLYMIKLLVFVGSGCNFVLDELNATAAAMKLSKISFVYRKVKQAALLSLVNFFAHIDNFEWEESQISCLTHVFVWPNIEKLTQDCLQTPTALLKLLLEWGQQPRLFQYLNQQQPGTDLVIFHFMIELMLCERAKSQVQKPLMSLVERLLVCGSNIGANDSNDDDISKTSLVIVKPFISKILQRLKQNFRVGRNKQNQKVIKVDKQQLNVLSLLTNYVEDSETCENLLELMFPVLLAKSQASANDQTVITHIVITLKNLIRQLRAPETQLLKIAPLFEFVQDVGARKLLCELVMDIASKRLKEAKKGAVTEVSNALCERLKEITRLTLMLNAYDKRWIEQPDYDKRLDALKQITQQLEQGKVDLDLGVVVIYHCCYYLRYDKDMGLRDNASEHLRLLLPKLTQQLMKANETKQLNYLVGDIFINLTRRLIGDTNENIRSEGVRLLGTMTRQCADAHVMLKDLAPLTDPNDEEADFFENLTHLQSHRHGRALLKFCTHAGTLTTAPATRTLTEFLLPLISRYLLQEKYASKHTLVDAAIEALGVACQLLPWQQYHAILRYYLQKMRRSHDYQKQCVRIVVRILDAFHFDLTIAENANESTMQAVEQVANTNNKEDKQNAAKVLALADDDEGDETEVDLAAALEEAESVVEIEATSEISENNVESSNTKMTPLMSKATSISINASKRILTVINTILIPTLNRAITERTQYDTQHKVNRRRVGFERESEEILRVPIALAIVKLMQKLPKDYMENGLPGVFMKVCTFLRSPLKSVRMLTREILKKIMLSLGSSYLPMLVEHLQSLLTRGFQVHVLTVTIHGVLDALRGQFQAKDIDNCLANLLEIALNDIFGDPAAEKEVQKIAANTPEAKPSAKSYLVLHIAARNIQEKSLLDLLMPFKDHLARSHARKLILKIQECFAKIVSGLCENPHITREGLLVFIYGMISESITDLLPGTQKRQLSEKEKEKMRRARPDCYIIQPTPQRRQGAVNKNVKSNAQANAHILIEFGLELLHIILKRKKLNDLDHQQAFLNPMLPLLRDALGSTHIRVTTFTLKCIAAIWNNEYNLPDLDQHLPVITTRMFEILKNLSTFGASKQEDNIQLIKSTLKALVALLRQCPQHTLTPEQVDQLVLHIEQDLYEGDKQPLSFALLKVLIARKVDTPSVHSILKQVAELSITSQSDYVRDECRNLLLTYVMEYTLHKRVDQLIKNFSVQLCYTVPTGRMSAIQFLASVIKRFPQRILSKRAEFLYLSLGTRLVNDDDSACRKAVAECIESLLLRLEKSDRNRLFEMTVLFFEEAQKPSVREMAASLCSRFLNVEKRSFVARLPEVLPVIAARLAMNDPRTPGKFVRAPTAMGAEIDVEQIKAKQMKLKRKGKLRGDLAEQVSEESVADVVMRKQRAIDHEIIQMQYCMHKMLDNCLDDIFQTNDETLMSHLDELAYTSKRLLAHEHAWVRTNAAKTISQILAKFDFALISQRMCCSQRDMEEKSKANKTSNSLSFIYSDPASDIKSLVLDLCAQLAPGDTPQEMIDEMVKIFLLIANILRNVPFEMETTQEDKEDHQKENDLNDGVQKINLKWLFGRIRYLINKEIAQAPHCVSMRTALFHLIEGLIAIVPIKTLVMLAPMLLSVLVREMSEDDQQIDPDLRQLALHVGSRLRKTIGSEIYDKLRTHAQTALLMRRAERKKGIAQEKIHDPVKAAKRKAATQDRKKAAKKRKTDVMRGKVEDFKQKLKKRKRKADMDDVF